MYRSHIHMYTLHTWTHDAYVHMAHMCTWQTFKHCVRVHMMYRMYTWYTCTNVTLSTWCTDAASYEAGGSPQTVHITVHNSIHVYIPHLRNQFIHCTHIYGRNNVNNLDIIINVFFLNALPCIVYEVYT